MHDLHVLQSEAGLHITVDDGASYTLRAVLCHIVGDTLAMHEVFELLSPSANLFCRGCYITREDLHSAGGAGKRYDQRTRESVARDLAAVQAGTKQARDCGVKQPSAFYQLPNFDITTTNTFDPMHDLLEGVIKRVLGDIILLAVKTHKTITIKQINDEITNFDYGSTEIRDKPSANFKLATTGAFFVQSAAQTWLLLRAFPFMFENMLTFGSEYRELISCLLLITYYSFSDKLLDVQIGYFEEKLKRFFELYPVCFPDTMPINKMHHLSHYPEMIRQHGPLAQYSCMLFEMKFRDSKALSKVCNNFRNLPLSITKRLNLRQVQSILNHDYIIGQVEVISCKTTPKNALENGELLEDLPEQVNIAKHIKIDNTSFRPGLVTRFLFEDKLEYGIIVRIIMVENDVICIVNRLNQIKYDYMINSVLVTLSGDTMRVNKSQLLTKKTYNLWKKTGKSDLYLSMKYNIL